MMRSLVDFGLGASALALFLATLALVVQSTAMLLGADGKFRISDHRPRFAVVVPAHNEQTGIADLVNHIRQHLNADDRLIVVADNCSDSTAKIAAKCGADVVVRDDTSRVGKGFALEAGLRHLAAAPPEVVIFIDADCRFSISGAEMLARACASSGTPVQCLNLMLVDRDKTGQSRLAEFAWRIRNDFRPTGYARLGLPCQLFGTGMAIPWRLIDPSDFATGHVAEDLLIGLQNAVKGFPPRFFKSATVFSYFPESQSGRAMQKRRWLHGHLSIIGNQAPKLIVQAWRARSLGIAALAADLMAPPLVLLALAHSSFFTLSISWFALSGSWLPLALAALCNGMLAFSIIVAWFVCGRDLIGWAELREIPLHILMVLRASIGFLRGNRSAWMRADRASKTG